MTTLQLADSREAVDLTAFLGRLLRYDKAAVVRLQSAAGVLAVFGRPPFDVLAVRTARLARRRELDSTVSAGQLLEGIREERGTVSVPPSVTGPPWAGMLPPRGGWQPVGEFPLGVVLAAVAGGVAEFRARSEALAAEARTRAMLDQIADEIWSRPLGGTALPLRAVHAAHALGFLRPARAAAVAGPPSRQPASEAEEKLVLLASGPWLRLRTPYGSVAVRRAVGPALPVSPVSPGRN